MIGGLRLLYRSVLSLAIMLLITVTMMVTWQLGARQLTRRVMQSGFIVGAILWGLRIKIEGAVSTNRPLLVVSNHFSYLDLFVLGSLVPAAFTPKSEIASWPLIGFMCKASGCLFIDRRASQTKATKKMLDTALAQGDIISLFPEGTTNEGVGLLPFKSSFFSIALGTRCAVQPVSIIYTALNDKKMDDTTRPQVGWYGDALFFPHVLHFLQQRNVDATVIFHAAVNGDDFSDRKDLAAYCANEIAKPFHFTDKIQKKAPPNKPEALNQTMEGNSVTSH